MLANEQGQANQQGQANEQGQANVQAAKDSPSDVTGEIDVDPASIMERVDAMVDGAVRMLPNLAIAVVVFLTLWMIGKLVGRLIRRTANAQGRHDLGQVLGGFVKAAITLFGIALAMTILAPSLSVGSLVSSLGIGSVAIGFAFQDILQNWLAGLLILLRQPFEIGDQIVVKDFEGTVEHIETRATIIRTYDGQRVVIPNSEVYTNAVIVRTAHDTRRSQWEVGVGYSTDIDEACDIALRVMGETRGVLSDPAPEALPWELAASGVSIRLRWWTESARATVVHATSDIVRNLKTAYDDAAIDIPYETNVVLFHDQTDERDGVPGEQFEGWGKPADGSNIRSARQVRGRKGSGDSASEKSTF